MTRVTISSINPDFSIPPSMFSVLIQILPPDLSIYFYTLYGVEVDFYLGSVMRIVCRVEEV